MLFYLLQMQKQRTSNILGLQYKTEKLGIKKTEIISAHKFVYKHTMNKRSNIR